MSDMSDPRTLEDIEVFFTSGDPLFIADLTPEDTIVITEAEMRVERAIDGQAEVIRVPDLSKVTYWKRTLRTVIEPETRE